MKHQKCIGLTALFLTVASGAGQAEDRQYTAVTLASSEPAVLILHAAPDRRVPDTAQLRVHAEPPLPSGWTVRAEPAQSTMPIVYVALTARDLDPAAESDLPAWAGQLQVLNAADDVIASRLVQAYLRGSAVTAADTTAVSQRWWWVLAGNALLWLVVAPLGYYLVRSRPRSVTRRVPHGRLVPADGKTRRITPPLDLRKPSLLEEKMRLLLGAAKGTDVPLVHDDMQGRHAYLAVVDDEDGSTQWRLLPLPGASVRVNGRAVPEAATLRDGDMVQFGTLRFVFEIAELYRPVVVECLDGRRLEGFPIEWDTSAPGFMFRPRDASAVDAPKVVPFSSIRAVHFVTDWDPEVARLLHVEPQYPAGEAARIRFHDGKEWCGKLTADYHPDLPRFHFLPSNLDGVIVSLIERTALATVVPLEA